MASPVLTKGEQNFIRFVKICLDVFKLPLADILASEIQPADLYKKIQQHSCSLLNGKHRLDSKQENICFRLPPAIPDYNEFDVTLLYKLIRNLCPSLEPTKGWGKDPVDTDTQIGDDIERLRLFRNNNFHDVSSEISDKEFDIICKKLKFVFQRIQIHMASKGYKANYEENMTNIKQLNLGDEHIDKYKIAFLERTIDQLQADGMEKPKISIKGPTSVLCGNNAKFSAEINPENLKGWSITWQKIVQQTYIRINSSTEKYSGSTDKILVIQSVCKGDSGGYQTILSRDSEAKNISVSSNVIVLRAIGGPPIFEVWDVTTGMDGIKIHYGFKKRPPYVNEIKWIKDEVPILNRNKKFEGGGLNDSYFTITSPTIEDRGNYSCVVKNAVGSVQKDVKFDVPYVEISTEQEVYFGSKTSFTSRIVSCPSLDRVEWQQSNDGKTFKSIIISKPKYYGSSCDPKSPLLIIPKVKFEDKLYYRLLVWNKIGEQYSNTVFLDVKGSLPNITINHKTCVSNRSITLIGNVFLYGKFPAVKNVFWTKNGEELDTKGSGGRYSEVTVDNPSLAIFEVNEYDAGSYQLIATNALGSTTSDFLILDVPDVSLAKPEKKNSGFWFTVTIQSIPAPDFAQWSMKEKSSDTFIPIDENAEEFKGTSNTLPHPVLVVNPNTDLENYCFQIEVRNFIGSCKKITPGEGSSEDSFTNGNQGGLSKIYLDGGAGLKFAKLFDDIAELFPEKKTRRLKDFIQNSQNGKDITLFAQTVTARDCLEILRDHKLFTPWDVIFMQYLLKNTECKELFEKCVAYAEAHWALCFYEKLPENGFKNVQFHVRANLSCYTPVEIRKIKETVADIVGCNSTEVFVNGYSHSSSFLAVLSIEKKHVKKLLTMNQQEKGKLSRLKIDFFIVDFIKVYLQSPQEIRGADDTGDYPIMLRKLCDKPTTLGSALFEKHSKELVPDTSDIVNAIQTASISVSVKEVKHISCLMPNRLWVSDMKKVQEIDKNGRILKELDIYFTLFGSHTVTQSGDLLFLKDNDVLMLTSNGEVRNLSIHASVHFCIHSSRMNGDILIGDINTVTRYNNLGIKLNEINLNDEGQSLYVETIFITENTNGDIIVSDNGKKAVVATDKSGRFFFNYKGHHSQTTFHPGGICTDDFGHILVCNVSGDPSVHLLHQKGQFLAYLLTKHQHGSDCPQAVCVDSQHNLYVGYSNSNRINVYSYPTKEKLGDLYTKEIEANTNLKLTAIKRKSYNDLNVTPTPHFDEKTNWSLSLNEKHLFKGHSVSAIAPTKKISMVDSQNVEKRATKTDSVEEKGSDLDVTFMRKQEVRPITPRKSFYKAETYFAKKINSEDTRRKSRSDLHVTYAAKQKEWSRNMNEEPNVFFTKERMLYCDKMLGEESEDNFVSDPTILPRYISSRGRLGDSVINMNIYDSDDENVCLLQQKPQSSLKDQRYVSYNMMKTAPPIPPRKKLFKKIVTPPPIPPRKKLSNYSATYGESWSSLKQMSTATLKDPTGENYDTAEMAPPIPCRKTLPKKVATYGDTWFNLKHMSTATLKDPTGENYDTAEMAPPIPCRKPLSKNVATYGDTWSSLKQTSTATLKDSTGENYDTAEMGKEQVYNLEQRPQIYQLESDDYSSDEYFSTKEKALQKDAASVSYLKLVQTEKETMSSLHQKSPAFKQPLWHFETINRSGGNYTEVEFHIKQDFLKVSEVMITAMTVDAVRAIVGCHSSDILTNYYDDSNNSVNLVIDELFLKYLLSLTNENKDTLRKLEIDYFNADFITVFLEHPKDIEDELYHKVTHITDEIPAQQPKHGYVNLDKDKNSSSSIPQAPKPSAISMILKPILSLKGVPFSDNVEQKTSDGATAQVYINTAIHTKRITVLTHGVKHISCFSSNKIWVSDFDTIEEIDEDGHIMLKLDVKFGVYGRHTVTRDGNLIFLKARSVYILTSDGNIRNLYINAFEHSCIHASKINSDIFVATSNGVTRYSERGKKLQKIEVDDKGQDLYGRPTYITENSNGDIIVSDEQRKAIVVVDKLGRHRFNYKGYHSLPEFNPRGVCTDVFGHILVCNHSYHDPSVHLLDENGHYLTTLLTKHRSDEDLPQDVCVDDKHNLYVGCGINNIIDVYKYLA